MSPGKEGAWEEERGTQAGGGDVLRPRPAVRTAPEAKEAFPAAHLLRRPTPEDVYSAISQADPLQLSDRCARALRAAHYLLDAERLRDRALVRVAVAAMDYRGEPPLGEWVEACIARAVDDLLNQDREELRSRSPALERWDPRFEFLTYALAIESGATLRASVAFNGLSEKERWAFLELLLHKRSIEELLEERGCTEDELAEWTRCALEALYDADLANWRKPAQNEEENP